MGQQRLGLAKLGGGQVGADGVATVADLVTARAEAIEDLAPPRGVASQFQRGREGGNDRLAGGRGRFTEELRARAAISAFL